MNISLHDFSGLLLDFDGTLANTEPIHALALKIFFHGKGYEFGEKEPGKATNLIFREWGMKQQNEKLAESFFEEYCLFLPEFFQKNYDVISWQNDTFDFLKRTEDVAKVLVTGSYENWLRALDPKLHIFENFSLFVTREDVLPDHEKPDPLAYILGAEKLKLLPSKCLALEDSYSGILSAKRAGCTVVAVKRDSTKGFEFADMVVNSLTEIL
ncbi:HAD family phosphatase [Candidatus Peregrinibacteria bacterium]|nr:HAD family phosphatase [Candidatus Peregrinibacteria bacterium]